MGTHAAVVVVCLLVLPVCQGEPPVVTSVRVSVLDGVRELTLEYEAPQKPIVMWKVNDYLRYMDTYTNVYSGSQGVATMRMNATERNTVAIVAILYADSYQISVVMEKGDVLDSEEETNVVPSVTLQSRPGGTIDFKKGDTVEIQVDIESPDLTEFRIVYFDGQLISYDNEVQPPAMAVRRNLLKRETSDHWDSYNVFIMPKPNITENTTTVASTIARVDTSYPYCDGELKLYVKLQFTTAKSLVDVIKLRSWAYLKEQSQDGPFMGTLSFFDDPQNRKRLDMVHPDWPYTQIEAMGFPKPQLKLFKGCREIAEPEVEIFNVGTPYRTRNIIRFPNVTDSLEGVYYMKAVSGDREMTKQLYIQNL